MRLIDADALLEKLKKTYKYFDLKFYIEEAPTIEPSKSTDQNRADVPSGDLISRADAIMELNGACSNWQDDATVAEIIQALPRVSAERSGEWLDVKNEPFCECSVCGAYIENLDDDFAFCPRCGARMKGGDSE